MVEKKAPLVLPPSFGELPEPGMKTGENLISTKKDTSDIEEIINQSEPILSSIKTAHLFSPQQDLTGQISSRGQGISVCIPYQRLHQELINLSGKSINSFITFQPEVDLTTALGHSLKELILFAWQSTACNSLFLPQLEQTLLTGLLQYHSHNYSAFLQKNEGMVSDRTVRLAQEFMMANLQKPISLGDIASAIGVSGRSLQRSFFQILWLFTAPISETSTIGCFTSVIKPGNATIRNYGFDDQISVWASGKM